MSHRQRVSARSIVANIRQRYELQPGGKATIYVLHFTKAVKHARHYVGFAGRDPEHRFKEHRAQQGSALVAELMKQGGDFVVALQFRISLTAARSIERKLKDHNNGPLWCPICARATMDRRNAHQRLRAARFAQQRASGLSDSADTTYTAPTAPGCERPS